MRPVHLLPLACLCLAAAWADPASPQGAVPARPDTVFDLATRRAVVDSLADRLERFYIFPEVAKATGKALRQRAARREYDGLASANAFVDTLTAHVQAITHDKHIRVRWRQERVPPDPPADADLTPEVVEEMRADYARVNFGFERVQRLPGNVGYLDLRTFAPPGIGAGETAVAAMGFLAHCDALIVDLRRNGGGDPEMADLLITYLYPAWAERRHVNDFVTRKGGGFETSQYWTAWVPGPRLAGKDVYVLTGPNTFSCAEEFAYDIQNLKRGTLVGEVTGGGANPGGVRRLSEHFAVFVPTGRAQNPVTKTNWEGVGVKPEVAVAADSALAVAHGMALEKLIAAARDDDRRQALGRALETVRKAPIEPLEERWSKRR